MLYVRYSKICVFAHLIVSLQSHNKEIMKVERILYCIFSVFLFAACSGGEDYEQQLEWFEEMNRTDVPLCVDSVQPLVRHYDHWWHSRNHRMRAYYMLGCAYRDQGSAPRALENYQRAVSIADTTDARCDLNTLMRIHSQMAQLFLLQRLPEQEEEELRIAERLAWQIGDTLAALIHKEYFCFLLYSNEKYKECINQSLNFYDLFLKYGYENDAYLACGNCVKSYLKLKDYVHAQKYIALYEACPFFRHSPNKVYGGTASLFLLKGQYYIGVEQADSAEKYFRKVLQYSQDKNNKLIGTKGLYQVSILKHNLDSVLKYTQLYAEAKENDFNNAQSQATIQAKAMYDYSVEKEQTQRKTETVHRLILCLIATIFSTMLITLYYLYRNERRKRKISELRQQYQQICNELKSKDEEIRELINKQDTGEELIKKIRIEKEELMIALSRLNQTIKMKTNGDEKINLSKTTIVDRFKKYRDTLDKDYLIKDEHWVELHNVINKFNSTFCLRVNALQQLSESDYKVCMLVYAGFSATDISVLMNFSESAASNSRRRLNKKVFGVDGTPAEFDHKLRLL